MDLFIACWVTLIIVCCGIMIGPYAKSHTHEACFIPLHDLALNISAADLARNTASTAAIPINPSQLDNIAANSSDAPIDAVNAAVASAPTSKLDGADICIPWCSALDDQNRCVVITGCGYAGNGWSCGPEQYSGAQVLGFVLFASLVTFICMMPRGRKVAEGPNSGGEG